MTRSGIMLVSACLLAAAGAANAGTPEPPLRGDSSVTVQPPVSDGYHKASLQGGKVLYVFGGARFAAFKPYVKELLSPKGVNPLRDNVPDHIHHHGLMFAVAVDGVDFWAETKNCGRQIQGDIRTDIDTAGSLVALSDTTGLDWTGRDSQVLIATEKRTIVLYSSTTPVEATLISWRTQLAPPAGAESIKLTGSHYFGLGMRFVKSMDNASTFTFADPNAAGPTVRGDEKLTPSAWAACTGAVDGNTVTVAMFDHPDNPRPVLWFTMGKPFSYLSATINLAKEPMIVKAGQELDVCYGLAVWDGKATREQIDMAYRNWQKLAPSLKPQKKGSAKR